MAKPRVSDSRSERNTDLETVTAALLSDLSRYFSEAVTLTDPDRDSLVLSAWVLHAVTCQAGEHCTFLVINADESGAGKSDLTLHIKRLISESLLYLLAMPSVASIKRRAEKILIIDQADTLLSARGTDQGDFTGWLNSCHTKGFHNWLTDPSDINGVVVREPFGARALAGINIANMLDESILQRSVIIDMRKEILADVMRERMSPAEVKSYAAILEPRIAEWAELAAPVIASLIGARRYMELANGTKIFGRDYDIWSPLVQICKLAGADWFTQISDAVNIGIDSDTGPVLTRVDRIDAELRALMWSQRLTVDNWLKPGNAPIPAKYAEQFNFPLTNEHLGYQPGKRYASNNRLPGGSLKLEPKTQSAELRFNSADFEKICAAMDGKRKKRQVLAAYYEANRLRASGKNKTLRTNLHSGQSPDNLVVINVSHWFWTEQEPGMSRIAKEVTRIIRAETENEVWEADR